MKHVLLISAILAMSSAKAECLVVDSSGRPVPAQADALYAILSTSESCPADVFELKAAISQAGLKTRPYLVSNRGFHNTGAGSFSVFEQVQGSSSQLPVSASVGEFFFGHFTGKNGKQIELDQRPNQGSLMIELIAWDHRKKLFNFYELIGAGNASKWFYRGDSSDILKDNAQLYLPLGKPRFGDRLPCSGCHTSGGPIMKEIEIPHNDWWTQARPLSFAPNVPSKDLAELASKLGDAHEFSFAVKAGIQKLERSSTYQKLKSSLPTAAQLRPLFCEVEINLESDKAPLASGRSAINVPSAAFVNPFLAEAPLQMSKGNYESLVSMAGMKFPEINRADADHAWLAPVKGHADLIAIQSLINNRVITKEFAADVLAVDFKNSLFSKERCQLLSLLPRTGGLNRFIANLQSTNSPGAQELFANLTDSSRNLNFHVQSAREYLIELQKSFQSPNGSQSAFQKLLTDRAAVFRADISQNPRGQILEPGFRVIFPQPR
jgi:hypothetical protein